MAGNWNSGRRPTPTKLKVLRGNPGKRRLNANEPEPAPLDKHFDIPPRELAGDARASAEWRRVAPLMRECGLISQAERSAIIALCQQWSRYLEAQVDVRKHGMIIKRQDGGLMTNPNLDVGDRALSHCHRLWSELGLTPSGRARVSKLPSRQAPPVSKWGGLV